MSSRQRRSSSSASQVVPSLAPSESELDIPYDYEAIPAQMPGVEVATPILDAVENVGYDAYDDYYAIPAPGLDDDYERIEDIIPAIQGAAAPRLGEENPHQANVDATRNTSGVHASGQRIKGMQDPHGHYQHETETAGFRGGPGAYGNFYTHYWDGAEQAAHQVGSDPSTGKLGFVQSGRTMETRGASGAGTAQVRDRETGQMVPSGRGKHIYTMDGTGALRATDPAAEMQRKPMPGTDGSTNATTQLGFVNHSSTVQGGNVAAAGDMAVEDGRLSLLSNASGHYRPDVGMLHQAAHRIGEMGAMNVDTRIEMAGIGAQTDALTFLGASHGQEDIARDAFGSLENVAEVEQTAARKRAVMAQIKQ